MENLGDFGRGMGLKPVRQAGLLLTERLEASPRSGFSPDQPRLWPEFHADSRPECPTLGLALLAPATLWLVLRCA